MTDPDPQSERRSRWKWSHALHAALVMLHPLSAFLLPWRAGERDARMAIGLLRVDPVRRRGILCAMCYLSVGAGKVLLSGFIVFFFVVVVLTLIGKELQAGWLDDALKAIVIATVIAAAGLLILTFVTSLLAVILQRKLWIDDWPDPITALDGRWPPVTSRQTRRNATHLLVGLPWIMIPIAISLFSFDPIIPLAIFASGMVGMIPARWITKRVVAQTPEECYPETPQSIDAESLIETSDGPG